MARNTNQVFGTNLNIPADFVLFYAEETSNPLRPKGGTGQAVEMARRKGIPTINMATVGWEAKLEGIIAIDKGNNATTPYDAVAKLVPDVNWGELSRDQKTFWSDKADISPTEYKSLKAMVHGEKQYTADGTRKLSPAQKKLVGKFDGYNTDNLNRFINDFYSNPDIGASTIQVDSQMLKDIMCK